MTTSPWLSVIGIGEDGVDALGPSARHALAAVQAGGGVVFGGSRHLAMVPRAANAVPWRSPIEDSLDEIEAARPRGVAVLASGDPSWFGIARLLVRRFGGDGVEIHPAPSAFSLAAARMRWALEDTRTISVCGRPLEEVWPRLRPGARLLILCAGAATPQALAEGLSRRGHGASTLTVLEHLGGPAERIRAARAERFDLADVAALNLVALECDEGARDLPSTCGLADDLFATDGTMTKRVLRAAALSALAPRPGELLWDIGAGSGSVTIEWLRAAEGTRAIAIEPREDRRALIAANVERFCTAMPQIVAGKARRALGALERPDAVFIGGGLDDLSLDTAIGALKPGGRLVAHGVTLETTAILVAQHELRGGELLRIGVESAEPLGRYRGWRPAMPVVHWHWQKART